MQLCDITWTVVIFFAIDANIGSVFGCWYWCDGRRSVGLKLLYII